MPNYSSDYKSLDLKHKLSIRFRIVFVLFMFWTLSQILIPVKFLSYEILSKIEVFKTAIPIFLVLVSTFLYRKKLKLNTFLWPFLAFGLYILITALLKYTFFNSSPALFEDIFKYVLWVLAMFFVFPKIFDSLYKIKFLLKYSIILISFFIMLVTIFLIFQGVNPLLFVSEDRMELFYGNPLYLGGISYTVLCSSLLLMWLYPSNLLRYFLTLLVILSLLLIYMATARTFLLATSVIFLTYYYYTNKTFKTFFWLLIFPLMLGISFYISTIDINNLSSNRLFIWNEAITSRINLQNFVFGNFDLGYVKSMTLDSGEIFVQSHQRYSIDNSYIELFINTGIFGFFLFIFGIRKFLSKKIIDVANSYGKYKIITNIFFIAYSSLISLLVAGMFYGHYPSFGNTLNSVLFPALISIIFITKNYILEILKTNN